MDETRRFGELSTEEIQEIMDKAVPETTKKVRLDIYHKLFFTYIKIC